MIRTLGLAFMAVSLWSGSPLAAEPLPDNAPTLTMAFGFSPESEPIYGYFRDLYTEAFRRLGFRFNWQVYPLARCSALADAGDVDGEPQRVAAYGAQHPNLLRVDTPIYLANVDVYTTDANLKVERWSDLSAIQGTIVYLLGAVATQSALAALLPRSRVLAVADVEQGLEMVRLGRATAFVDLETRVRPVLIDARYRDVRSAGTIDRSAGYPYLNKKWATLVPRLAKVLVDLQSEGFADRALHRALAPLE